MRQEHGNKYFKNYVFSLKLDAKFPHLIYYDNHETAWNHLWHGQRIQHGTPYKKGELSANSRIQLLINLHHLLFHMIQTLNMLNIRLYKYVKWTKSVHSKNFYQKKRIEEPHSFGCESWKIILQVVQNRLN